MRAIIARPSRRGYQAIGWCKHTLMTALFMVSALAHAVDLGQIIKGNNRQGTLGQAISDMITENPCEKYKKWVASVPSDVNLSQKVMSLLDDKVFLAYFGKTYDQLARDDFDTFQKDVAPVCRRRNEFTLAEGQVVYQIWNAAMHPRFSQLVVQQRQTKASDGKDNRGIIKGDMPTQANTATNNSDSASDAAISNDAHDGPPRFKDFRVTPLQWFGKFDMPPDSTQAPQSGAVSPLKYVAPGYEKVTDNSVQILTCAYTSSSHQGYFRRFELWYKIRPQLSEQALTILRKPSINERVDVAASACPSTYEQMLKFAYGDDLARYVVIARQEDEIRVQKGKQEEAARREAYKQAQIRDANEVAPLSIGELAQHQDDALVQRGVALASEGRLLKDVAAFEAAQFIDIGAIHAMTPENAQKFISEKLEPDTEALLAAASATLPQVLASKQAKAFDEWETRYAYPVFAAYAKVATIVAIRNLPRATGGLVDVSQHQPAILPQLRGWESVNIERRAIAQMRKVFRMYETWFRSHEVLDSRFMAKTYEAARLIPPPADDKMSDLSDQPTQRTYRVFYGTPTQILVASTLHNVFDGLKETMKQIERDRIARMRDYNAQAAARRDFWTCYKTRCSTSGEKFLGYLSVLGRKELVEFIRGPNAQYNASFEFRPDYVSGVNDVDRATPMVCEHFKELFNREFDALPDSVRINNTVSKQMTMVGALKSVAVWRDCRDKVEYIMRPRN